MPLVRLFQPVTMTSVKPRVPEQLKREIRAVLLSKIGGVPLTQLPKDYSKLTCQRIPWQRFGFNNLEELLAAIPDVAQYVY